MGSASKSLRKKERQKKKEERNSDNGQNKKIKTPTPMLVSKQAAVLAYSNQKRARKRGKELLLGAKTEALQWLGMMVPLLQCSSSQEVRWCFIPLNIVPSCCHPYAPCLIFFSLNSILFVQKYFTSENVFSCVAFSCICFIWWTTSLQCWCPHLYFTLSFFLTQGSN